MKRGDVVLFRESNSPASKARPCVVVQRTSTIEDSPKITACPMTSTMRGEAGQRPSVLPSRENGLRALCEVQFDRVFTFERSRCGPVIGTLDQDTMRAVDTALRRWLNL